MVRLSQRAINNVVIFAMLAMIALFNLDRLLPDTAKLRAIAIVSDDDYVLKIEHERSRLERAGGQWRQITERATELAVSPEKQLASWYQAILNPADAPSEINQGEPIVAVIWVAGQPQGRVVAFYPRDDKVWVKYHGQWYLLGGALLSTMLPWL